MKKNIAYNILAVVIFIILVFINYGNAINAKKVIYKKPPDIERLMTMHSSNWYEVKEKNVRTVNDYEEYDIVRSKIYCNDSGNCIQLLMTWSGDGIVRGGHIQQNCYNASGNEVIKDGVGEISIRKRKLYYTYFEGRKSDKNIEDVIYWRVTGGEIQGNYTYYKKDLKGGYNNKFNEIKRIFLILFNKEVPDNLMIRITNTRTDIDRSNNIPHVFLRDYLIGLSEKDLNIIIGKKIK